MVAGDPRKAGLGVGGRVFWDVVSFVRVAVCWADGVIGAFWGDRRGDGVQRARVSVVCEVWVWQGGSVAPVGHCGGGDASPTHRAAWCASAFTHLDYPCMCTPLRQVRQHRRYCERIMDLEFFILCKKRGER